MKVLLTGATGFLGRNICHALENAGHQVSPASRRSGFDFSRMVRPDDWRPHLVGIDAVINCVGIISETGSQTFASLHTAAPLALFQACADAGVRRVLQISALGADESAFSAYQLSKRAADDALRRLDIDWFVLRPSLIFGRGGSSAEFFLKLARWPLLPVLGDGQQPLQPIHISDVVAAVMACLTTEATRKTVDVVGCQSYGFGEWLQLQRLAQNKRATSLLHVPLPVALAAAGLLRHLMPLVHPDNLRMLQASRRADAQPLAQLLGRQPLAIRPSLFFSDAVSKADPT